MVPRARSPARARTWRRSRPSYRQLMRKYHPDMHAGNPQKQKAATELSMRVTAAYNGLVAHLEKEVIQPAAWTRTSSASKTALMVCAYRARASRWARAAVRRSVGRGARRAPTATRSRSGSTRGSRRWSCGSRCASRISIGSSALAVDRLIVRQVVILGAGYDTRAARLPRAGVRVLRGRSSGDPGGEARAARRARRLSASTPRRYVTCNFEREDPIERLAATGFARPSRRS